MRIDVSRCGTSWHPDVLWVETQTVHHGMLMMYSRYALRSIPAHTMISHGVSTPSDVLLPTTITLDISHTYRVESMSTCSISVVCLDGLE